MKVTTARGGLLAAAATVLCVSVPAQAAMGCWNETQVAAAKVRDLQSRLMVATVRCQARGMDITYAYNRFIIANRNTIRGANGIIMGQFRSGFGNDADYHYDRYATALANAYGGDETDPWVCAETEDLAYEAAAARGDVRQLVALAERVGARPHLPGGRCEISFARVVEAEPRSVGLEDVGSDSAPAPAPSSVWDAGEPDSASSGGFEAVEADPVPRDRLDEVDEIPAPSAAVEDVQADPEPRAPVKPAHKSIWPHI